MAQKIAWMNRRIKILRNSMLRGRLGGSASDWLLNCFGPTCGVLARRLTCRSEVVGDFREIELRGVEGTLYVNKRVPSISIKQAIAEQSYAWQWHYYQVPETTVSERDVVFDCGCAEGIFPFLVKGRAAKIVCFEPLPEFLIGLKKTFSSCPSIHIVEAALGDNAGDAYLREAGIMSTISKTPNGIPVKITTIDRYCAETGIIMTYLKADVEGYEMPLLRGASGVIKKFKPKIAITTYHLKGHAEEIKGFLQNLVPSYHFATKGIEANFGEPVMLHAW